MEIVKTNKGKAKILHDGFAYVMDKRNDLTVYWRCVKRGSCKGRLTTVDGALAGTRHHNHPAAPLQNASLKAICGIKEDAQCSLEATNCLINKYVQHLPVEIAEHLPSRKGLKKRVQRSRRKMYSENITDELRSTTRGDQFIEEKEMSKKYTLKMLDCAIQGVKSGTSVSAASKKYSIPRQTLGDRITGKSQPTLMKRGRKTMLLAKEEDELCEWIKECGRRGFGMSKLHVRSSVKEILDLSGRSVSIFKNNMPGDRWMRLFLRRHPDLKIRKSEQLEVSRAIACTEERIRIWFEKYSKMLDEEKIAFDPSKFYNADETGFPFQDETNVILTDSSHQMPYKITSPSKTTITALICISAGGEVMPPFVLYPGKSVESFNTMDLPPNSEVACTDKGWMSKETFFHWVKSVFFKILPALEIRGKVVLILDHTSHINYETSKFCKENGIVLFCLPPHTTHVLKPLDIGYFGPFKKFWRKSVSSFTNKSGSPIDKDTFAKVFTQAYLQAANMKTCINAFRATGLFPLNPEAINFKEISSRPVLPPIDFEYPIQSGVLASVDQSMSDQSVSISLNNQHEKDHVTPKNVLASSSLTFSPAHSTVLKAFEALEGSLSQKQKELFDHCYREAIECLNPLYAGWREIKKVVEQEEELRISKMRNQCQKEQTSLPACK